MTLPEDTLLENRYRIDRLLAHGGMGAIYRAFDTNLRTPVAIKENFFQTAHHIAQFKQEALILARLRHPALPRVIHHFSFEGQQYLVMDYIEGENLWEIVQKRGEPLKEREALDYVVQVCQAVGYLHRQTPPIIHRDIKPQNIKITPEHQAILVDFGIAKQVGDKEHRTEAGAQGVTSGFSPPEQYGGEGTNTTSDIYSLGATLYAVLTGKKPPNSVSLLVGKAKFESPNLINPKLSKLATQAIVHAMQPKSADRPQSIIDWQRTLELVIGSTAPIEQDHRPTLFSSAKPKSEEDDTLRSVTIEPLADTTVFWLVDPTGMGYPLGSKAIAIGRHSSCEVTIEDLNISRSHALIKIEAGKCLVKDENSANGTFLNGHRLRPEWYPLNQGDVLIIGSARFYLTSTRPVKLAPPKQKIASIDDEAGTALSQLEDLRAAQPATEPKSTKKSPDNVVIIVTLVGIIIALLVIAGYVWANPDILSGFPGSASDQGDVRPTTEALVEALATELTDTPVPLTAQAEEDVESTAQTVATEQADATQQVEDETVEPQAIVVDTPTPRKNTSTPDLQGTAIATATLWSTVITQSLSTATPTPGLVPIIRPAPTVAVPTLIPLQSSLSIDQIGDREVTDVDINPKNPNEIYALLKGDGIYKSSNGGDGPWAQVDLDGSSITSFIIDPTNPVRLYASTWNAVLKSKDGGNEWQPKTNGLLANQVVDTITIHPSNPDILFAGIGQTLVVSRDQAENWSSEGYGQGLGFERLYHIVVDPFDNDVMYVGGLAGSIYKSTNSGRNFIQLRFNTGKGTFGLAAHPTQRDVYLAGINSFEGGIIKTVNGADFSLVNSGLIFGGADAAYSAITYGPSDPSIVYAGSGYESDVDAKGIFKSIDGGESWSRINNGLTINRNTGYPHYVKSIAIHPTNPDIVFAATGSGLYKSVDGGANWSLR